MPDALVVETASASAAIAIAERLRSMGYVALDAYTPFPVPELDDVLGVRRTRLPWAVLAAGASGTALAISLMDWMNGVNYPLDVGGRPPHSFPTYIPIAFEVTVLLAAFTAFGAALVLSGLPRLHHRVHDLDGFERTTLDRFWIVVRGAGTAAAAEVPPPEDAAETEIERLRDVLTPLGAIDVREPSARADAEAAP